MTPSSLSGALEGDLAPLLSSLWLFLCCALLLEQSASSCLAISCSSCNINSSQLPRKCFLVITPPHPSHG